jgi:hypothetical protein
MSTVRELISIGDPAARTDRYMERQGGRDLSSSELLACGLFMDIVEAHDELLKWTKRHPNDCAMLSFSPLTVSAYASVFTDPDQNSQKENWKTKSKRKNRNRNYWKEWDDL